MSLGPLMIDLEGRALTPADCERLAHPLVGGVILFSRNYSDPLQIRELIAQIHELRRPRLLIAVDHEGGRVQRFRDGFTPLPAAALFGRLHRRQPRQAERLANLAGWLMAIELRAVGVDFSFAPVLDMGHRQSRVIGDRAFSTDPDSVISLARATIHGMQRAGMVATGKHFPGHGGVVEDSHHELPVDQREYRDLLVEDLRPFEQLAGELAAVMPAHLLYPRIDPRPAGFSPWWIGEVLRRRLGFQGAVFSDDLSMGGALGFGDIVERAEAALSAGCDMVLVCNDHAATDQLLERLVLDERPVSQLRLARMHGRHPVALEALHADPAWQEAARAISDFTQSVGADELELDG